ncbi:hypothetical protein HORIV_52460 [Vreelandella olivaria]|uniref:Uncharacterized protein n=1 Tax=Vreelandella olivaria TaxID=390919 RepID=A0ABN5X173_9GAMM|nr:hypothetical protein HORIV_52460 [Halomonas olivaria]
MTQVSLPFTREEYATRLWKVRAEMASRGIDVLIVSDPSNMAWLTGYDGWSFYVHQCVLVGLEGEPVWFGRRMDANGALRTCWIDPDNITYYPDYYVQNPDMHPMEYLAQSIMPDRGWHLGVVGMEMDNYYFSAKAYLSLLKELPHARFMDANSLVNWCRAIKSPQEVEYMRIAAKIVEGMHTRILEVIEPGLPKSKLVSEIYRVGIEGFVDENGKVFGGDYPAIVPMLPTGKDAAAPHLTWDDTPFRKGEGTFFEIAGCLSATTHRCRARYFWVRRRRILFAPNQLCWKASRTAWQWPNLATARRILPWRWGRRWINTALTVAAPAVVIPSVSPTRPTGVSAP